MINWGSVPAGAVLPFFFDAFDGGTGASITLTGLAITDVEVYKGTSMTQRTSDAGVVLLDTDGIDVDGITGIHGFSIDTGDNTDAGFYAVGSFFTVVVSAVTIDAQTVSFVAGTFRLLAAEAVAGKPKADVDAWLGTAAATPTVAGVPEVDVTHWRGTAAPAEDTAGYPKVTIKDGAGAGEINTNAGKVVGVELVDVLTTYTGNTPQTGDVFPLASTEIADIKAKTDNLPSDPADASVIAGLIADIQARLPAALVGGRMDSNMQAAADGVLTAAKFAAGAFDAVWSVAARLLTAGTNIVLAKGTGVTGFNDLSAAQVNAEADTALADYDPPTRAELTTDVNSILAKLLKYVQLVLRKDAAIATDNATEVTAINADGGSGGGAFANTTDSQEAIRDRGDAEWITATGFATPAHVQEVEDKVDAVKVDTAATLVDTAEMQPKLPTNNIMGSSVKTDKDDEIDAILDDTGSSGVVVAAASKTGYALSAAGVQAIWDALTSALTTVGSIGKLLVDNINATISSRASQTSVDDVPTNTELATALGTADDAVLTQVSLVKAKTDLIPAAPAAVGDVPTANANADALLDRAAGVETGFTPRQALRLMASVLLGKLSGAATATNVFRDVNDTKDRVTATVDPDGNRTAVTKDAT